MVFFLIAVLAGMLTVLAPCILPLLPIVIGSADAVKKSRISARAIRVIASLSVSVIVFTLLLKASTILIDIPQSFWNWFSGSVIILVGLAIMFPAFWAKLPFMAIVSSFSNKALGSGFQKKSTAGDFIMGTALGPVFTTCSPTYFFIIGVALPASFLAGFIYLIGFTLGLAISLLAVAFFGQRLVGVLSRRANTTGNIKKVFGALIIFVGISIITGYDKKFQSFVLDSGYGATINFEENLLDRFNPMD